MWTLLVSICVLYSIVDAQDESHSLSPDGPKIGQEKDIDLTGPLTSEVKKKLNTPVKVTDDLVEVEEVEPNEHKNDDGGGGADDNGGGKGGDDDNGGGKDGDDDDSGGKGGDKGDDDGGDNKNDKQKTKNNEDSEESPEIDKKKGILYQKDMMAGDMGDLAGANKHRYVPRIYTDFARRSAIDRDEDLDKAAEEKLHQAVQVAQQEVSQDDRLRPVKADPKLVMNVALQSAQLEASKPVNPSEKVVNANIMRNGDYWNNVYREDVPNPSKMLRSHKKRHRKPSPNKLEAIRVKFMPGSKLYELVAFTKRISPKLLYIINSK